MQVQGKTTDKFHDEKIVQRQTNVPYKFGLSKQSPFLSEGGVSNPLTKEAKSDMFKQLVDSSMSKEH